MGKEFLNTLAGSFSTDAAAALGRLRRPAVASDPVRLRVANARGMVLVSYLREPVKLRRGDPRLDTGHPNKWDSWLIAATLMDLGWNVDVIDWDDDQFEPNENYDLVIAIDGNGARLAELVPSGRAQLALHLTTAYPRFHNGAEHHRLTMLSERRGQTLKPRRQLTGLANFDLALQRMSAATLIGNQWTLSTYPQSIWEKITKLDVTTTARLSVPQTRASPEERSGIVWFGGGGAVHKGLDLTLESLALGAKQREVRVIGALESERDFLLAYRRELFGTSNVHYEGYLTAGSPDLDDVLSRGEVVVAPTCSEGMSNALAYALSNGLIPVYSASAGLDVPDGLGILIRKPEPDEISTRLEELSELSPSAKREMASAVAEYAADRFSRKRYSAAMESFLRRLTNGL